MVVGIEARSVLSGKPHHTAKTEGAYVIVAMANATRAAGFRAAALELSKDVALAPDGAAAVRLMARRGPPQLLITDLSLPTLDGFALVRQLREISTTNRSAVIVISAHESLRTAARDLAPSLGIANVLRPDLDGPSLRAAIAGAIHDVTEGSVAPSTPDVAPRKATETSDYDELLHDAVVGIARRFQMPLVGAYIKTNDQERFVTYASAANPETLVNGSGAWNTLPQVAASGEALVVPDVLGHPVFGAALNGSPVRGFATMPITSPLGRCLGALCVADTRPLTLDASALDALAMQTRKWAVAWAERFEAPPPGAPTYQALELLASTDPLTGLANRRGGEKSITSEISRAKREQRPLSCIMIDVDRFKQVNDAHGHPAGDRVLRELSAIMRRSARAYDILSRWGGEEFLLVLPGADLAAARALAERIRIAIEHLPTQQLGGVTISAGTAAFDPDYNLDATIHAADQRLYQAKAAGRNRVM